ncbi:MAG: hypothetical protein JRN16_04555 [Nitrososphaerota archaeon]|nr:hypothetical protein [Nitrososphaerota archaeon]MDG7027661.1 hypothetical protein [Nitrososphaerota archaeon]
MTTSPSPAIRLAYFIAAMVLYNLWQLVNMRLANPLLKQVSLRSQIGQRIRFGLLLSGIF